MEIKEWVERCYTNAKEHGFIDQVRSFSHDIAMCHCELSEALQCFREEEPYIYEEDGKPEGVAVELADTLFRIFTICGERNIDIEEAMERKYQYNLKRPWMHGKKF